MKAPLFKLGQIAIIPGALKLLDSQGLDALSFINWNVSGDWVRLTRSIAERMRWQCGTACAS